MSNAKTLMGIIFLFGFLAVIFSAMSLGTCGEKYASWLDFSIPSDPLLPWLDQLIALSQYMVGLVLTILDPCSEIGWLVPIIMIPLAVTVAYLAFKGT